MNKFIGLMIATSVILSGLPAVASEVTGGLSTGLGTSISGTVVVAPTASPVSGSYTAAQSVTLSASGALSIRYTTDGTEPSCSIGTTYGSAIAVPASVTIKAIACFAGNYPSSVSTFGYTITIPLVTPPGGGGGGGGGGGSTPDTTAPTNTSVVINSGAATTESVSVSLTLAASDTSAIQMMISNTLSFSGLSWEPYAITKAWTLTEGLGVKTVYVKFKDASDNTSVVVTDTISLVAPVAPLALGSGVSGGLQRVLGAKVTSTNEAQLDQIVLEAMAIRRVGVENILALSGAPRNEAKEKAGYDKYVKTLLKGLATLPTEEQNDLTNFIVYGTPLTKSLGAGERAGVLGSYKAAFGKLPTTQTEWEDAIKISIGRWPTERSPKKEAAALVEFKKIYKREAVMTNRNDNAAITIMAYGLRTAKRNKASENAASKIFKAVYKHAPLSASDWDIVRAIAYSGAKR